MLSKTQPPGGNQSNSASLSMNVGAKFACDAGTIFMTNKMRRRPFLSFVPRSSASVKTRPHHSGLVTNQDILTFQCVKSGPGLNADGRLSQVFAFANNTYSGRFPLSSVVKSVTVGPGSTKQRSGFCFSLVRSSLTATCLGRSRLSHSPQNGSNERSHPFSPQLARRPPHRKLGESRRAGHPIDCVLAKQGIHRSNVANLALLFTVRPDRFHETLLLMFFLSLSYHLSLVSLCLNSR